MSFFHRIAIPGIWTSWIFMSTYRFTFIFGLKREIAISLFPAGKGLMSADSEGKAESFQIRADGGFEFGRFRKLAIQFRNEARHLLGKGFTVVFDFLGPDVAAGREDMPVRSDFGGGGRFAEAGNIGVAWARIADDATLG